MAMKAGQGGARTAWLAQRAGQCPCRHSAGTCLKLSLHSLSHVLMADQRPPAQEAFIWVHGPSIVPGEISGQLQLGWEKITLPFATTLHIQYYLLVYHILKYILTTVLLYKWFPFAALLISISKNPDIRRVPQAHGGDSKTQETEQATGPR